MAAKHDTAHRGLAEQFAAHSIKRLYWALIYGSPALENGKISGIWRWFVVDPDGAPGLALAAGDGGAVAHVPHDLVDLAAARRMV